MSGVALAGEHDHGDGHDPSTAVGVAVALTNQEGAVLFNFAKGTDGYNTIGNVGGTGLVNIQQNNGANSVLQDQNTLGAILNCSCSTANQTLDVSLAASNQSALVLGNVSIGAANTEKEALVKSAGGGHHSQYGSSGGHYEYAHVISSSTAVQSTNSLSNFGGTGLFNISQNNGNNSMLQSANTVAAVVGK
jgi:hypothetical protein